MTRWSSCLRGVSRWGPLLHSPAESQAGLAGPQEDMHHHALTQVHSEDKGPLAKLVKAIRPITMTDMIRSALTTETTSWAKLCG